MGNTNNPLKIAEVRQLVKGHKREHLEHIVDELYKILSKTQKLDNDVANLLRNPGTPAISGTGKQKQSVRSFDEVKKLGLDFTTILKLPWRISPRECIWVENGNIHSPFCPVRPPDKPAAGRGQNRFVIHSLSTHILFLPEQSNKI